MYKLQLLSGSGRSATYLLRLYGQEGDASRALVCKDDEIAAFVRLAGASLGPPLVATFANGRVEGWIEGRAITNARCAVAAAPYTRAVRGTKPADSSRCQRPLVYPNTTVLSRCLRSPNVVCTHPAGCASAGNPWRRSSPASTSSRRQRPAGRRRPTAESGTDSGPLSIVTPPLPLPPRLAVPAEACRTCNAHGKHLLVLPRLRRWLGLLNDAFPAGEDLPPAFREILGGAASAKGALAEEAAWLERLLGALPEDCFCHNDLQHGCVLCVLARTRVIPSQSVGFLSCAPSKEYRSCRQKRQCARFLPPRHRNIMALCQGGASGAAAPPADAAAGCAAEPTPPPPQLCFVDYEYAQFGPPQFDLANHFAECALWGSPAGSVTPRACWTSRRTCARLRWTLTRQKTVCSLRAPLLELRQVGV